MDGIDIDHLAVDLDCSFILLIDTAEAVHQGGLSGTVFAEKTEDLTFMKGQLSIIQRFDAGEGLADPRHLH